MIGWAQNWLMPNRLQTTRTTFAVGFANVVSKSIRPGPVCLTRITLRCQARAPQLVTSSDQLEQSWPVQASFWTWVFRCTMRMNSIA